MFGLGPVFQSPESAVPSGAGSSLMVGSVVMLVKAVQGRVDVILGILEGFTHPDGDWKPEF